MLLSIALIVFPQLNCFMTRRDVTFDIVRAWAELIQNGADNLASSQKRCYLGGRSRHRPFGINVRLFSGIFRSLRDI